MKTWQDVMLEITETDPADTSDTSNIFISYDDLAAILKAAMEEPSEADELLILYQHTLRQASLNRCLS